MARTLKPMKVDELRDRERGVVVELMLDRNDKTFFAEVQKEKISAPSIDELKKLVKKKIIGWNPLEWARVIELEVQESETYYSRQQDRFKQSFVSLRFEFCRKEIAASMSGKTLERPFPEDLDEDDRERQDKCPLEFAEHCSSWHEEKQIPFTEEAWATLERLKDATDRAREKLKELFDPKDKGRRLVALGGVPAVPLLGASNLVVDGKKKAVGQ